MIAVAILLARAAPAPDCAIDRPAALGLAPHSFDQVDHQGWRALAERGCDAAAADLIAAYRSVHPGSVLGQTMMWHEGQLRAFAGDYVQARPLLIGAINVRAPFNWFGWNDYVAATVAFVDRDRPALLAARARLAATPRPATHAWTDPAGNPIEPPAVAPNAPWPPNLAVVDALVRCFDHSYKAAYQSPDCA